MVEDKSFNRTDLLNTFGGLPDRLMRSIPNFVLEKNRGAREEYLEQLAFYDIEKWSPEKRPFLRLPDTPPPFQIGAGSVVTGGPTKAIFSGWVTVGFSPCGSASITARISGSNPR